MLVQGTGFSGTVNFMNISRRGKVKIQHALFIFFVCSAGAVLLYHVSVEVVIAQTAEHGEDYTIADRSDYPADNGRQEGSRSWLADKKGVPHGARNEDGSKDTTSGVIAAEVTAVLSPNEIEVKLLGKDLVVKLAGIKDCPCDFNALATKLARAETKASKGFIVVDAGTIVRRCREIKEFLKEKTADEVLIKLSGARKISSGRIAGVVRNKGEAKTLNDAVLAYAEKQHAIEKKNNQHNAYRKFHSKNK
jgi:hypothetical protein